MTNCPKLTWLLCQHHLEKNIWEVAACVLKLGKIEKLSDVLQLLMPTDLPKWKVFKTFGLYILHIFNFLRKLLQGNQENFPSTVVTTQGYFNQHCISYKTNNLYKLHI